MARALIVSVLPPSQLAIGNAWFTAVSGKFIKSNFESIIVIITIYKYLNIMNNIVSQLSICKVLDQH